VVSALAGLPVGLLWRAVAPLPRIIKRADGLYRAGGEGNEAAIAADGWFALFALLAGVLIALAVYLRTRPGRVVPLLALAAGGLLGAAVAWRVGVLLSPGPIEETARGLDVGSRFAAPLKVSAFGVLLAWPMGAVITYFAVAAGAEAGETSPDEDQDEASVSRPDAAVRSEPR
jgi:hypothetical protein